MRVNDSIPGALLAIFLMAMLTGCGSSSQAQEVQAGGEAAGGAAAEAAAAAASGYVPSIEAGQHMGEEVTVRGTVKDYSFLWGRKGKPVILLFDVPGIMNRGSSISDLETPASFKVVVWKKDASNFPPNFANTLVGKTLCVTGLIEAYDDDASISATDPSQIRENC